MTLPRKMALAVIATALFALPATVPANAGAYSAAVTGGDVRSGKAIVDKVHYRKRYKRYRRWRKIRRRYYRRKFYRRHIYGYPYGYRRYYSYRRFYGIPRHYPYYKRRRIYLRIY